MPFFDIFRAGKKREETRIYQRLRKLRCEIRLLEIVSSAEPVICKLHTVSLLDDPDYVALSYVWGDSTAKEDIIIDGARVSVTTNLKAALQHAQKHWCSAYPESIPASMRLWADAVCINQANVKEVNSQVRLMETVYSSAGLVMAWLGDEDDQLPLALETLEMIGDEFCAADWDVEALSDLSWLRKHPSLWSIDDEPSKSMDDKPSKDPPRKLATGNRRWDAINFLDSLPYWRRVWTFQEQALAQYLSFMCPSKIVGGTQLLATCETLSAIRKNLEQSPLSTRPDFVPLRIWWAVGPLDQSKFGVECMHFVAYLCRIAQDPIAKPKNQQELALVEGPRLERILRLPFEATHPKDHIYGVLGLLGSRLSRRLKVDYSSRTSVSKVYVQYASLLMKELPRLQIPPLLFLCLAGAGRFSGDDLGFPSWAPNLPEVCKEERPPSWEEYPSLGQTQLASSARPSIRGSVLTVTAIQSLNVSKLGPSLMDFRSDGKRPLIAELLHARRGNTQDLFRLFTEIENQKYTCDTSTFAAAATFVLAMRQFLGELCPEHLLDGEGIFAAFPPDCELNLEEVLQQEEASKVRVASFLTTDRRLRTFQTEQGYLGLGPEGIKTGDVICRVLGFPSLAVLRKAGPNYIFVGPCNVAHDFDPGTDELLLPQIGEAERITIV
ncbi:hypothetical protein ACJ41O_012712 [Fusarium nematophilum]